MTTKTTTGKATGNGKAKGKGKAAANKSAERIVKKVQAVQGNGNGQMAEERRLDILQKTKGVIEGGLALLSYDIDTVKNPEVPNPSRDLWNIGCARMQYSVWIVPQKCLEHPRMLEIFDLWDEQAITYDVIPQGEESEKVLISIAQRNIEQEIQEIHTSFIYRLDTAAQRLDAARKALDELADKGEPVDPKDYDAVEKRRDQGLRVVFRETIEWFEGVLEAANQFDDTMDVNHLLDGLRKVIVVQAKAFNLEMRAKKAKELELPKSLAA
jgi:hypothetical protein